MSVQQRSRRMLGRQFEHRRDLALLGALAHQVASPRAPSASAKASSRIDLPAPVSPVSTERPDTKSMSSRSIRTMSRIESRASMPCPSKSTNPTGPAE
jgi:hypothetical protein